jgi:plasmid stabilization system protein ParE
VRTVFSSVFESDFAEIIAYYASDVTAELSVRFEKCVVETFEQIASHPEIGRRRKDLAHPEIRSLIVAGFENYVIFYQIRKEELFFVRLLHGARHLPDLL